MNYDDDYDDDDDDYHGTIGEGKGGESSGTGDIPSEPRLTLNIKMKIDPVTRSYHQNQIFPSVFLLMVMIKSPPGWEYSFVRAEINLEGPHRVPETLTN